MAVVKEIIICKADPCQGEPIPNVTIRIIKPLPDTLPLSEKTLQGFYTRQARSIAKALFSSLPQAILDRLLYELMERHLSLYRGIVRPLAVLDRE